MKHIRRSHAAVCSGVLMGLMGLTTAHAVEILPGDLTDGSASYTTADGKVTLTPYALGLTPGTLGAAGFFGVTGGGNNNNIIDQDGNPDTTADREALDITLAPTVGISQFKFNFTRADGPAANDGIAISGFLEDPGATFSGAGSLNNNGITYNDTEKTLYISVFAWNLASQIDFSNLAASAGQTLRLSVNDSDQAGPVIALSSISYDTAPPPPARLKLIGIH